MQLGGQIMVQIKPVTLMRLLTSTDKQDIRLYVSVAAVLEDGNCGMHN